MSETPDPILTWRSFAAVFPRLLAAVGEAQTRRWLESYFQEMAPRDWEPVARLGGFALYLRALAREAGAPLLAVHADETAMRDWAEFCARFSPADEAAEQAALQARELVLNPSLQILTQENSMIFIFRATHLPPSPEGDPWRVRLFEAQWGHAAIIDLFLEEGRMSDHNIIAAITSRFGPGHDEKWQSHLATLIHHGILLGTEEYPVPFGGAEQA